MHERGGVLQLDKYRVLYHPHPTARHYPAYLGLGYVEVEGLIPDG